jgi:hypothetical protein
MAAIWVAALLLGSGFAVSTGRGVTGKVINVIIILGCMGLGAALGFAIGQGRGNMWMVPDAAWPFAMILGVLGAMICVAKDTLETKK